MSRRLGLKHTFTTTGSNPYLNSGLVDCFHWRSFWLRERLVPIDRLWRRYLLSAALASRFRPRQLLGSALLSLGLLYGTALLSAEYYYQRGWINHDIGDLFTARRIYPFLSYVKRGPVLALNNQDFMRVVREDPQAIQKLAAALSKLQPGDFR